jgi:uncharacterized protein DUF5679
MATQAYCVKCKAKRDMKNEKQVTKRAKVVVKQATKKKAKKTLKAKKK